MEDIYFLTKERFGLDDVVPNEMAPLTLAYIGDAVYEVVIRNIVISKGNKAIEKIHKKSVSYVNAKRQADIIDALKESLSDEEMSIYKRGKNAKTASSAKNASLKDYHKATGFEALIGYLYLMGQTERMLELIKKGIELTSDK